MIKAIETHYNGYKFRSRLEARWAVFFDTLGIKYEYERQGYVTAMGGYLPDFWLPDWECYIEVKPDRKPTDEEIIKVMYVALDHNIVILCGNVEMPVLRGNSVLSGAIAISFDNIRASGHKMIQDAKGSGLIRMVKYNDDPWCVCEIPTNGSYITTIAVHIPSDTPIKVDGRPYLWHQHVTGYFELWPYPEFAPKGTTEKEKINNIVKMLSKPSTNLLRSQQSVMRIDTPQLTAAYNAARSARFEFGETPRTPRGKPRL